MAHAFGRDKCAKLDHLTISLAPPDATIGLITGGAEFKQRLWRAALPEPAAGAARHPHRAQSLRRARRLAQLHRRLDVAPLPRHKSQALCGADRRAHAAAALWIEDSKSKLPLDLVHGVSARPQVTWTLTPEQTMKFAGFMQETRQHGPGLVAGSVVPRNPRSAGKLARFFAQRMQLARRQGNGAPCRTRRTRVIAVIEKPLAFHLARRPTPTRTHKEARL